MAQKLLGVFAVLFLLLSFCDLRMLFFLVFASVFHEIGHLLSAKLLSLNIKKTALLPFRAVIETEETDNILSELILAASGPLFNIILSLSVAELSYELSAVSFCIALFNLLPLSHLDGGRMIGILISIFFGEKKGRAAVFILSNVLTVSMLLYSGYRMLKYGDSPLAFLFGISALSVSRKNEYSGGKYMISREFER